MRAVAGRAVLVAGLLTAAGARAGDRQQADTLFREAAELERRGSFREACARFQQSARLDRDGARAIRLAQCREREGNLLLARLAWQEALGVARAEQAPMREQIARSGLAKVEGRLGWIVLSAPEGSKVDAVSVDGVIVPRATWDEPVAVEPGTRALEALSGGAVTWRSRRVVAAGATARIVIEDASTTPRAAGSSPEPGPGAAGPPDTAAHGVVLEASLRASAWPSMTARALGTSDSCSFRQKPELAFGVRAGASTARDGTTLQAFAGHMRSEESDQGYEVGIGALVQVGRRLAVGGSASALRAESHLTGSCSGKNTYASLDGGKDAKLLMGVLALRARLTLASWPSLSLWTEPGAEYRAGLKGDDFGDASGAGARVTMDGPLAFALGLGVSF